MRIYAGFFAAILALQSAWLLAAEAVRPVLPFFPTTAAEANLTSTQISAAATAAWIGWPRGELWIDYAGSANAALLADLEDGADRLHGGDRGVAETAAALAPADARAWVLLAAVNLPSPAGNAQALAQLKTSYYTSPYNDGLFPARIQIAARSPIAPDEELRGFVDYELGQWLRARPVSKRPIALAYRNASPAGRTLLSNSIGKINPALLAELRSAYP